MNLCGCTIYFPSLLDQFSMLIASDVSSHSLSKQCTFYFVCFIALTVALQDIHNLRFCIEYCEVLLNFYFIHHELIYIFIRVLSRSCTSMYI